MISAVITKYFRELFKTEPRIFRAPGRINLLGEHTDYNLGFVLPAAIDKYTYFAVQKNNEMKFRFYSYDYKELLEVSSDNLHKTNKLWANYLLGVIAQFRKENLNIEGLDVVFSGNVPQGAGLSSSASLEVGFALAINTLYGFGLGDLKLVKMAQMAEHEFAGVLCGIMDQYAAMFGKPDSVIKLDCRSLEHEYFPLKLNGYKIVIADSKVKHSLASSEYNTRRQECEEGIKIIQKTHMKVFSLRDVTSEMLESMRYEFTPTIYRRCSYVVHENNRVLEAVKYLQESDLHSFGTLMHETHEGLRVKYEVSCKELDFMENVAHLSDYVIGARMMGGGFGGCTINIVHENFVEHFTSDLEQQYKAKFGKSPAFYVMQIAGGACEVTE